MARRVTYVGLISFTTARLTSRIFWFTSEAKLMIALVVGTLRFWQPRLWYLWNCGGIRRQGFGVYVVILGRQYQGIDELTRRTSLGYGQIGLNLSTLGENPLESKRGCRTTVGWFKSYWLGCKIAVAFCRARGWYLLWCLAYSQIKIY